MTSWAVGQVKKVRGKEMAWALGATLRTIDYMEELRCVAACV